MFKKLQVLLLLRKIFQVSEKFSDFFEKKKIWKKKIHEVLIAYLLFGWENTEGIDTQMFRERPSHLAKAVHRAGRWLLEEPLYH